MTRDDLTELQELASSIADERRGWRAKRRAKSSAAARRRLEAEMHEPVKRRRRHRWVAGLVVSAMVVAGAVLIVVRLPGKAAPKPLRTTVVVNHLPGAVKVGQAAAARLTGLGQVPNIFACQSLYDTEDMGSVAGQGGSAWRADYLQACLNSPVKVLRGR
jgi:hypothetical protein